MVLRERGVAKDSEEQRRGRASESLCPGEGFSSEAGKSETEMGQK